MLHRLEQEEDRHRWTRSLKNPGLRLKVGLVMNQEELEVVIPQGKWDALLAKSKGATVRTWNVVDRGWRTTGW